MLPINYITLAVCRVGQEDVDQRLFTVEFYYKIRQDGDEWWMMVEVCWP